MPAQSPCLIADARDRGRVRRFLNAELEAQVRARRQAGPPDEYRLADERIDVLLGLYRPLLGDARPAARPAGLTPDRDPTHALIAGETLDSHLYEVWLDGVRQPLAVRADGAAGYVTSYETDAAGQICRREGGRAKFVTAYGDVEIHPVN